MERTPCAVSQQLMEAVAALSICLLMRSWCFSVPHPASVPWLMWQCMVSRCQVSVWGGGRCQVCGEVPSGGTAGCSLFTHYPQEPRAKSYASAVFLCFLPEFHKTGLSPPLPQVAGSGPGPFPGSF